MTAILQTVWYCITCGGWTEKIKKAELDSIMKKHANTYAGHRTWNHTQVPKKMLEALVDQ